MVSIKQCLRNEEQLVSDLMARPEEMSSLPMLLSIIVSCLIQERARSVIHPAGCKLSDVSGAALLVCSFLSWPGCNTPSISLVCIFYHENMLQYVVVSLYLVWTISWKISLLSQLYLNHFYQCLAVIVSWKTSSTLLLNVTWLYISGHFELR